jgi:hypothetical protein
LPIPYAKGTYPAKPLIPILGGLLTFESDWNPPLGQPFQNALTAGDAGGHLDIGCVAAHGHFIWDPVAEKYTFTLEGKPAKRPENLVDAFAGNEYQRSVLLLF